MNASTSEDGAYSMDTAFSCLAHGGRRRLVRYLSEAPGPLACEELATALAASTHTKSCWDVTDGERRDAAVALRHRHLPSLTAAGLVDHDADADTVTLADHPALRDPGVLEAVAGDAPASTESLDALFRALSTRRNRTVLGVLSHQFGAIHVETLARELRAEERDTVESEITVADVEQALVHLHHVDLPTLADVGLVDRDTDARTVEYTGNPVLRVPWMHSVFQPDFRSTLTGESDPGGIGEITDRERVISYGQSLCDRADAELFAMFTDTDLLEAGCLTRIRDAAQVRDVDVYLGTCDPVVREYVEENAPEVTLWEPNTSWLNLPVAGDRVGRLLMADREAVMLGTLMEERADGFDREQAMVGEGEHNTLVTTIRQLLAPHIEEVDEGTEDIEARLPL